MGKKKNRKNKGASAKPLPSYIEYPDRTRPTRQPRIIPIDTFEAISDYMLQLPAPHRNVFLSVNEYSMNEVNPMHLVTEDSPTHMIVFCLRLIMTDQFNPIGVVQINKRFDQTDKLVTVWKAFIQDLSILRLIVIGSISPASLTFHDVLSKLTENPNLENHTGPITYSVWPYQEILHLYDYYHLMRELQDTFYECVDLYFITRPSPEETANSGSKDPKLYSACWTDILLTIASDDIKCVYTTEGEMASDLSIFSSDFKDSYERISRKGLIVTDTKASTDRLMELLWSYADIAHENINLNLDDIQDFYDKNEDLRVILASARFRWFGSSRKSTVVTDHKRSSRETCNAEDTIIPTEHQSILKNDSFSGLTTNPEDGTLLPLDETSLLTERSIELGIYQMNHIMTIINDSLKPHKEQSPFDSFLQKIVYNDYDLFIKTSTPVQSVEEQEMVALRAERALVHDHDYIKKDAHETSPPKTPGKSRIASLVKDYFESLREKRKISLQAPESKNSDNISKDFTGQKSIFPSSMHNGQSKETDLLLPKKKENVKTDDSSNTKRKLKSQKKSNKLLRTDSSPPPSDDFMLIPYDTPKMPGHNCDNCDNGQCKLTNSVDSKKPLDNPLVSKENKICDLMHAARSDKSEHVYNGNSKTQDLSHIKLSLTKQSNNDSEKSIKNGINVSSQKNTSDFGPSLSSASHRSAENNNKENKIPKCHDSSTQSSKRPPLSNKQINIRKSATEDTELVNNKIINSKEPVQISFCNGDNGEDIKCHLTATNNNNNNANINGLNMVNSQEPPEEHDDTKKVAVIFAGVAEHARDRTMDGLDLATTNKSTIENDSAKTKTNIDNLTKSQDFSNIFTSHNNSLNLSTESDSLDSLNELISTFGDDIGPTELPFKHTIAKKTNGHGTNEETIKAPTLTDATGIKENQVPVDLKKRYKRKHMKFTNFDSGSISRSGLKVVFDWLKIKKGYGSRRKSKGKPNATTPIEELENLIAVVKMERKHVLSNSKISVQKNRKTTPKFRTNLTLNCEKSGSKDLAHSNVINYFKPKNTKEKGNNKEGESRLSPCCSVPSTSSEFHSPSLEVKERVTLPHYTRFRRSRSRSSSEDCTVITDTNSLSSSAEEAISSIEPQTVASNKEETDEKPHEVDYLEYRRSLLSVLCDRKKHNCDIIFNDRDSFNNLFNMIPEDSEYMRVTNDWLCTFKGYLKLKEILEQRKVKFIRSKLLCLDHIGFYVALIKKLKNNVLATVYDGPGYKFLDYRCAFDLLYSGSGVYILRQDKDGVKSL